MHNFNHERLGIVMQASRLSRVCIEEAFKVLLENIDNVLLLTLLFIVCFKA